jgi:hypothetical protein
MKVEHLTDGNIPAALTQSQFALTAWPSVGASFLLAAGFLLSLLKSGRQSMRSKNQACAFAQT